MSLTGALRDELAHAPTVDVRWRIAEVQGMFDLAGALQLRGGQSGFTAAVRCTQGSVARRLRSHVVEVVGQSAPEVQQVRGSSLRGGDGWRVQLDQATVLALGRVDEAGRPRRQDPLAHDSPGGYLAGALMAAGTLSGAGSPVHLELRCPDERLASTLATLIPRSRAVETRVVVKSGEGVGALLARVGAHKTFLAFDEGRMRRDLRRDVNRTVNADRANLRRTTGAAALHIRAIERAVSAHGWTGLPEDLVPVALARVANPEASLAELGELLDPPVGKATVHRRLQRLVTFAEGSSSSA